MWEPAAPWILHAHDLLSSPIACSFATNTDGVQLGINCLFTLSCGSSISLPIGLGCHRTGWFVLLLHGTAACCTPIPSVPGKRTPLGRRTVRTDTPSGREEAVGDRALTWSFCASCAYDVERVRSVSENGPTIRHGPQRRVHVPGAWCASPPP